MFWKWDQSCNLDIFPFDRSMHLLENILWSIWADIMRFGGDQVKAMGMIQDKYERRFLLWNLPRNKQCLFREEVILNPHAKSYAASRITSLSERHSNWGNMSWSHKCERRIIFENLLGTNAVNFRGVDTFQQLHTSFVPWGERQHRGEVDRHCLALFCWRKAHCCLQIRMIGHFFRNYIWIHSLYAFRGPMHVPHAGWITGRHCIDWQILSCCCRWQLLPK